MLNRDFIWNWNKETENILLTFGMNFRESPNISSKFKINRLILDNLHFNPTLSLNGESHFVEKPE
jgi:hypothetical protein